MKCMPTMTLSLGPPLPPTSLPLDAARVEFSRAGDYVLAASVDRVTLWFAATGRQQVILRGGARAVAGFDDQVWLVADGHLHRHGLDGRPLGAPLELGSAEGALCPAPCGPPGVLLLGSPSLAISEDLGVLATHPLPDAELLVPLTARRVVAITGSRLQLPSRAVATLPPGSRVLAGHVLADGASIVIATVRGGQRELVTLAVGTGRITSQLAVAPGLVRIAARRALAAVQLAPRVVGLIDLRTGAELGTLELPHPIEDFTISADGDRIATCGSGTVELASIRHRLPEHRNVRARGTLPPEIAAGASTSGETAIAAGAATEAGEDAVVCACDDAAPAHVPPAVPSSRGPSDGRRAGEREPRERTCADPGPRPRGHRLRVG